MTDKNISMITTEMTRKQKKHKDGSFYILKKLEINIPGINADTSGVAFSFKFRMQDCPLVSGQDVTPTPVSSEETISFMKQLAETGELPPVLFSQEEIEDAKQFGAVPKNYRVLPLFPQDIFPKHACDNTDLFLIEEKALPKLDRLWRTVKAFIQTAIPVGSCDLMDTINISISNQLFNYIVFSDNLCEEYRLSSSFHHLPLHSFFAKGKASAPVPPKWANNQQTTLSVVKETDDEIVVQLDNHSFVQYETRAVQIQPRIVGIDEEFKRFKDKELRPQMCKRDAFRLNCLGEDERFRVKRRKQMTVLNLQIHHIHPCCFGGNNNIANLIFITPAEREKFIRQIEAPIRQWLSKHPSRKKIIVNMPIPSAAYKSMPWMPSSPHAPRKTAHRKSIIYSRHENNREYE